MARFAQKPSDLHRHSVFPEDRTFVFYIQSRCQPSYLSDVSQIMSISCGDAHAGGTGTIHLIILLPHLSIRFINIELGNQTDTSKWILLGLTEDPELQSLIFSLFLIMYLVTVLGNLLIILVVSCDSYLHTPMYFFLSNLSFTDICLSTTTIPKMLVNIQTQNQSITYTGCLNQIFFVVVFGYFENFLLAAMAYDRYVAICHPLMYTVIMNPYFCGLLILLSLFISVVAALINSLMVFNLLFCTNLKIPQFFCDLPQILKLACSSTLINNILIYCNVKFSQLYLVFLRYLSIVSEESFSNNTRILDTDNLKNKHRSLEGLCTK
ncbi:PREDICTED: olfactory receptor 7G2-like, partial [Chrysochloris asiatica]|uniref:Olfactory receptor n=1 Tax=Chrysochloris asiatica TaxID=185453 RepID=A0A9B0X1K4_CHRAS